MNNTYRRFVTDKKDRRKDVYEHECVFILKGAEGKAWDTQEDDWKTNTVAHRLCLMEGVLSPFPTALLLTGAEFSSEGENEKIKSQTD